MTGSGGDGRGSGGGEYSLAGSECCQAASVTEQVGQQGGHCLRIGFATWLGKSSSLAPTHEIGIVDAVREPDAWDTDSRYSGGSGECCTVRGQAHDKVLFLSVYFLSV